MEKFHIILSRGYGGPFICEGEDNTNNKKINKKIKKKERGKERRLPTYANTSKAFIVRP